MKINCFSITFWFNIFTDHNEILNVLQEELKDEYTEFKVFNITDNLLAPVITAINNNKMTNFTMSQINFQYFMDNVKFSDFEIFKEKCLKFFNLFSDNGIEICHTAVFINGEEGVSDAIAKISNKTISKNLCGDDLIDMTLKLGKKYEDLFYKVITILNKKKVTMPKMVDDKGRVVPIPLIPWDGSTIESEIIDVSYEINDKYSFDFTKNYHTTEFFLNKMLFVIFQDFEDDINSIIEKGKF